MNTETTEPTSETEEKLGRAHGCAMRAKDLIFTAQDHVNYTDGLREVEDALRDIRSKLEAFDNLCRRTRVNL